MRKIFHMAIVASLVTFLLTPASAGSLRSDLEVYVERLRSMYPEAAVISRFYDWRTVSIYRAHSGLHCGYDIAMNNGRAVPAGWPGRVVAITPWTSSQYGISVQMPNGVEVTYGHLCPSVHEGEFVQAGTFVGTTLIDHVDVKARYGGGYLDFGQTFGMLDGSSPWRPGGSMGLLPPPPMPTSLPADLESLYQRFRDARTACETNRIERDRVRELVDAISQYVDQESNGLPQAEQQMLAYYRAADNKQITEEQADALSLQVKSRRTRVNHLMCVLDGRQHQLQEKEAALAHAQSTLDSVRAALKANGGADNDRLQKIEQSAMLAGVAAVRSASNSDITRRAQEARTRMLSYQERYNQGGVARTDLDQAVHDYNRLHLVERLYENGDRDAAYGLSW